jgi:hypothetical protein
MALGRDTVPLACMSYKRISKGVASVQVTIIFIILILASELVPTCHCLGRVDSSRQVARPIASNSTANSYSLPESTAEQPVDC